jgi:hypothetical protein
MATRSRLTARQCQLWALVSPVLHLGPWGLGSLVIKMRSYSDIESWHPRARGVIRGHRGDLICVNFLLESFLIL